NTWSAQASPISLPKEAPAVQVGATLGLIVARDISYGRVGEVEHCISGLTVVNEVSLPHEEVFRPAIKQRCRDGFCPIGPQVVLADAAAVRRRYVMRTYINEELKHECSTDELVRAVPQLLADISSFMTLHAGTLVTIGVRRDTPLAKVGDSVTVEIDGIGRLQNTIVQEQAWSSDT
ncbi:MAG TPA: fumarylacetoacetate hydrolase family protein, partial [Steroidobacteraceae bacterium]|nr:fumarylacetoacetate hydrolase family protein [Steroidobacteraceae bacterium]